MAKKEDAASKYILGFSIGLLFLIMALSYSSTGIDSTINYRVHFITTYGETVNISFIYRRGFELVLITANCTSKGKVNYLEGGI
jgi:hypothetical protein